MTNVLFIHQRGLKGLRSQTLWVKFAPYRLWGSWFKPEPVLFSQDLNAAKQLLNLWVRSFILLNFWVQTKNIVELLSTILHIVELLRTILHIVKSYTPSYCWTFEYNYYYCWTFEYKHYYCWTFDYNPLRFLNVFTLWRLKNTQQGWS